MIGFAIYQDFIEHIHSLNSELLMFFLIYGGGVLEIYLDSS